MAFLERIYSEFENYIINERQNAEKTLLFYVSPIIKFLCTIWFLIFTNYFVSFYTSWIIMDAFCLISVIFLKIPIKRYFKYFFYVGILFPSIISLPSIFFIPGNPLFSFKIGEFTVFIDPGDKPIRGFV